MNLYYLIQTGIGIATLIGVYIVSYAATRSAISVLQTQVLSMQIEIESLRTSRHEHASLLTQHHFRLRNLDKLDG